MLKRDQTKPAQPARAAAPGRTMPSALPWDPGSASSTGLDPKVYEDNEEQRRRRLAALDAMAGTTGEFQRVSDRGDAIQFESVSKIYPGNVVALKDATFEINAGEWVFLVGASGSGKSTMLKLLLKEIEPTRGNIIVGGRSLSKIKRSKIHTLRRNIGCVFQDFKLLPTRSVFENVAYALEVQGRSVEEIERRVPEILDLVGISDKIDNLPHELSGGQQQRVSIAQGDGQPSTALDLRRADREPRSRHLDRDHAAPAPDPANRHDRADGDP